MPPARVAENAGRCRRQPPCRVPEPYHVTLGVEERGGHECNTVVAGHVFARARQPMDGAGGNHVPQGGGVQQQRPPDRRRKVRARLNPKLGLGGGCKGGGGHRRARPPWVEQCGHWGGWQRVRSAKRAPQAQQAIHNPV